MRRINKKTSMIIAMSIVMSLSTVNFASSTPETIKEQTTQMPVEKMPEFQETKGVIENITKNDHNYQVTIKNTTQANDRIALNVFKDTVIMDNVTGRAVAITDLKEGQVIYAYYGLAMTKSIPPQSRAVALLTNVEGKKSVARLIDVSEVTQKKGGSIAVLSKDGMYLITILKKTPIKLYNSTEKITVKDIKEGTRLFTWFDMMTLSIPAQATAQKVVVVPRENEHIAH